MGREGRGSGEYTARRRRPEKRSPRKRPSREDRFRDDSRNQASSPEFSPERSIGRLGYLWVSGTATPETREERNMRTWVMQHPPGPSESAGGLQTQLRHVLQEGKPQPLPKRRSA